MRKIDFWCLKHKLLAFILLTIAISGCGGILLYALFAPTAVIVIYVVLTALFNWIYVNFSFSKGVQNAIKDFDNCDPYPLYELTEQVLPYIKGTTEQDMILNKTSSLFWMGEHEKMLEILENLNIDKIDGTLLQSKIMYYNNLGCAYEYTDQDEQAIAVYKKLKTLYKDAKPKLKEQFHNIMIEIEIYELKLEGRYDDALEACRKRKNDNLLAQISTAMSKAKLYIALGDLENAKNELRFVYLNGSKTFFVEKAKKMYDELKQIQSNEQKEN